MSLCTGSLRLLHQPRCPAARLVSSQVGVKRDDVRIQYLVSRPGYPAVQGRTQVSSEAVPKQNLCELMEQRQRSRGDLTEKGSQKAVHYATAIYGRDVSRCVAGEIDMLLQTGTHLMLFASNVYSARSGTQSSDSTPETSRRHSASTLCPTERTSTTVAQLSHSMEASTRWT